MATPIKIPGLGTAVDVVKLLKWLKAEGDSVQRGDFLCEIETDKAIQALESAAEGILLKQVIAAGTEVREGTTIAYIGAAGEEISDEIPPLPAKEEKMERHESMNAPLKRGSDMPSGKISPLVRNLAKKLGVDLKSVAGTGPHGIITREDVQRAANKM